MTSIARQQRPHGKAPVRKEVRDGAERRRGRPTGSSFQNHAQSRRLSRATQDPQANILYGCQVLTDCRSFFPRKENLHGKHLLRAVLPACNCAPGNVLKAIRNRLDVNFYTAHRDYSTDVLNRAAFFQFNGWERTAGNAAAPKFLLPALCLPVVATALAQVTRTARPAALPCVQRLLPAGAVCAANA
jgi:hypothetical protein